MTGKEYRARKKVKKSYGRYSGQRYTNSKERLNEIKQKYKNGVTYSDILEMIGG